MHGTSPRPNVIKDVINVIVGRGRRRRRSPRAPGTKQGHERADCPGSRQVLLGLVGSRHVLRGLVGSRHVLRGLVGSRHVLHGLAGSRL